MLSINIIFHHLQKRKNNMNEGGNKTKRVIKNMLPTYEGH